MKATQLLCTIKCTESNLQFYYTQVGTYTCTIQFCLHKEYTGCCFVIGGRSFSGKYAHAHWRVARCLANDTIY